VVGCGTLSTSVDSRGGGEADAADMSVGGDDGRGDGRGGRRRGGDLVFDLA